MPAIDALDDELGFRKLDGPETRQNVRFTKSYGQLQMHLAVGDSATSLLDGFLAPFGLRFTFRRGRLLRLLRRVASTVRHVDHVFSPSEIGAKLMQTIVCIAIVCIVIVCNRAS